MEHDPRSSFERRERYLSAVVEMAGRLFHADHDEDLHALVLPVLLRAADASRAYVSRNRTQEDGRLAFRRVAEVVADGVAPLAGDPARQDVVYDAVVPRWRVLLEQGCPINGAAAGFPPAERAYLERQGVLSLLALPLTVDGLFYGFVGFDDCTGTSVWGEPEVELLQAGAAALSATLKRQLAVRALLESEDRYRAWNAMIRLMCDTVPDLIWAKDMEGRFLFTNTAVCDKLLLAAGTAEPVGRTDMDFVDRARAAHPERPDWHTFGELCRDSDAVVMESGRPERFDEFGNVRGEHLFLDVYKAPMFDDEGRMIGTVGCGRDVTEEREVAARLAENEARMAATLNAMPDIHLRIDRKGRFLDAYASEPARMLLPPERVIGATVDEILPPQVAQLAMESIPAALSTRAPVAFEYSLVIAAEERYFEARVVPCGEDDVLAVVRDVTDLHRSRVGLEAGARRLRATLKETVRAMGTMVEQRDPYTAGHERRVASLTEAVCRVMDLSAAMSEGLVIASEVHDVGKVGVPAEMLSKPKRLNADERAIVQEHAARGHEILSGIDFDWPVAEIVYQHHERLDGSGYPRGLAGDEILLEARILGAADVLEAMASHRPYRAALGVEAGLAELRAGAGTLYDTVVVAALKEVMARGMVDLRQN
jgi:HD-GYP domain-containing protein (c-di-GMP phosphodiesterase class II)